MLDQLHRIQSLRLGTKSPRLRSYVVGNSAPALQSLFYLVEHGLDSDHLIVRDSSDRTAIDTPFDHVDMPALRLLRLRDSGCSWSSPLLKPTLTQLLWEEAYQGTGVNNSHMADVFRVLRSMPLLEEVYLCGALPAVSAEDSAPLHDPFSLPRLSNLVIEATASSAAFLLQHVAHPSSTQIHVHCTDKDDDALPSLLDALSTTPTCTDAPPGAHLSAIALTSAEPRAWAANPGAAVLSAWAAEDPHLAPRLRITLRDAHTPPGAFLPHLHRVAPLERLTALYVAPRARRAADADAQCWAAAGAAMRNARTPGLGRHGFAALHALLVHGAAHGAPVVSPGLRVLLLRCVWMRRRPDPEAHSSVRDALAVLLAARSHAGCPVRRIVLVECINVVPEDAEVLRRLVEEVE